MGLGDIEKIDSIEIYWSDGTRESFPGPILNQYLVLKQGHGIHTVAIFPYFPTYGE